MALMKSATRVTSKAGNRIDILYGCLKDLPRDPLADLEAEHKAEIEADDAVATGRLEKAPVLTGDPEILALPATVVRVRKLDRHR